jgi:hypothetical protein
MITREQVEALSDEFQSTFTLFEDGALANMFHSDEIPTVEALIIKHTGAKRVWFHKSGKMGTKPYDIWVIRVEGT